MPPASASGQQVAVLVGVELRGLGGPSETLSPSGRPLAFAVARAVKISSAVSRLVEEVVVGAEEMLDVELLVDRAELVDESPRDCGSARFSGSRPGSGNRSS